MLTLWIVVIALSLQFTRAFVIPTRFALRNPQRLPTSAFVISASVDAVIVESSDKTSLLKSKVQMNASDDDIKDLISRLQRAHKSVEHEIDTFFNKFDIKHINDNDLRLILKHLAKIPSLRCDRSHKMRHVVMILFDILIYRPVMRPLDFSQLLQDFADCSFQIPTKYPLNKLCYTLRRMLPDVPDIESCLLQLSRLGITRRNIPEDILHIIGDKIAEMTNSCTTDRANMLVLALKQLGISMEDFDDDTYSHLIALHGKAVASTRQE